MRVLLNGKGEPISTIALPDPQISDELPPQTLVFDGDGIFNKIDWIGLGYTSFEAWCIGGSGGKGGDIRLEPGGETDPSYAYGALQTLSYGGEGGGGGLHVVNGLLVDLDDETEIVVGETGVPGSDGNVHYRWRVATAMQNFGGVPMMLAVTKGAVNIPGMTDAAGNAIAPYFYTAEAGYLFFNEPSYVAPQDGGDGGTTTFGDLAQASGGKGGKKSPVYRNNRDDQNSASILAESAPGGIGGEGGVGGQTLAGGGGAGGTNSAATVPSPGSGGRPTYVFTNPKDGTWDGHIGQGGGGGRGGTQQTFRADPRFPDPLAEPPIIQPSSNGGQGSFSYADTSVYGARGQAAYVGSARIVPGAGGGARATGNRKAGSRSSGYSPKGLVVVRVFKI